jgi:hypothetical protein
LPYFSYSIFLSAFQNSVSVFTPLSGILQINAPCSDGPE